MSFRSISPLALVGVAALTLIFTTGQSISGQLAPAVIELRIAPQDTTLNLDARNYSTQRILRTYTWPDYRPANAILMKLNIPALPAGAVIHEAKLHMRLVESDAHAEPGYTIAVHKVVGKNPVVNRATGYTSNGLLTSWTANTCCHKNVPLAQADLSPAYDTQTIDKNPGFKTWTVTSLVQEWIANPATNRGLVLTSDALAQRDRYRYFASMEHSNTSFRPYVAIKYSGGTDTAPPSVVVSNPTGGGRLNGTVAVKADASDNVGIAGVQLLLNGVPFGGELTAPPYLQTWNTTKMSDGNYTLRATARDSAGLVATSSTVAVTVDNGIVRLTPQDTSLNTDANNYSSHANLWAFTWPDFQPANAILMKFDLPALPTDARVDEAKLHLALVESDTSADASYTMTAHKIVGKNPIIDRATGYTADGQNAWTPNGCCSSGVPMAQGDLSPAYDTRAVDKTVGVKTWTITTMVQEWLTDPTSNVGMIINPDVSAPRDRFRFFASMDHADVALRPFLQIKYSIDSIPPTVALSAPLAGTTVSGTVNVAAVAADNTGVAGVQFRLDGANLGNEVTAAPYSQSWNSKNVANGSHTLTAVARDASGNTTTSVSVVVNVANDLIAPAVAITAPSGGATVSGTTSVAATASDNVGVAGVQFKLDGVNLGAEDSAAPYAVSWSTTSATDGSHTLTAIARDAAGNLTTSSPVTVAVANGVTQPPPSGGIATLYPGDAGIEGHPDVIFVDRFEETSLNTVFSRWSDILGGANMSLASDVPAGSPGSRSLNIPSQGGGVSDGGHLYKQLGSGVDDTLYVRYYIKYPTTSTYDHTGIWMGGFNPSSSWPNPQAGVKPSGNDRFIAAAEQNQNARFDHYNYWMNMRQSLDGKYWGNLLLNRSTVKATADRWTCVEHMVKLNNPVSARNGEHAIWLDGVKVSHLGQGFPNGSWSGGIFTQDPAGAPFEGFQWRNDANLKLNWIWLQNYSPDNPAGVNGNMYFDHVVVAKNYIGCLAGGSQPPPPPPPPPVTGTWPNEPTTLTLRTDWSFDQPIPTSGDQLIPGSPGWKSVYEKPSGSTYGFAERISDATAPFSPSYAYDFVFPKDMIEGNAPATVYYDGLGANEMYAGFWWKPSSPFDYGPNGNKIAFMFNGGGGAGGQQFMILKGDGRLHVLPEVPGDYRWRTPNVNATVVALGQWHRVEWYSNRITGVLKWWLDGVLQGSYTDVFNAYRFDMFQFSPTWGGNSGARKRQTDHYWFDHVRLSTR